jgi:hypothetical protein
MPFRVNGTARKRCLHKRKPRNAGKLRERGAGGCDTFERVAKREYMRLERATMEEQRPVQGQVQIKADEKELQGQYSNLVMIHHSLEEFTMNFIYIFPNGAQGKLLTSMIVSPGHAKRIWRALGENLARYEAQFGNIKESPEGGTPTPNVGFVQ